ncbi:hypothetical protein ILUMI_16168 [Ignelater luminosus]|uniref:Uncharacterized protein n=1 Tax=Ignelater luminosus TaxID=2038154 RepID=A0A8K0CUY8_IGNLU|nr:hypothetical protein ILUMI_16168 [Ignelater luminosus]
MEIRSSSISILACGIQMSKTDKPVSQPDNSKDIQAQSELEDCKTENEVQGEHAEDDKNYFDQNLQNINNTECESEIIASNETPTNVDLARNIKSDINSPLNNIENIEKSFYDTKCEYKEVLEVFSLSNNEEDEVYYDINEDENQDDTIYHDAMGDSESEDNEDNSIDAQRRPFDDYVEAINYLHQQIHHAPPQGHNNVIYPNPSRRNLLEGAPLRVQSIINYLNGQGDNPQMEDFERYLFRQNGQAVRESITVRVEFSSYTKLIAFFLAINTACLFKLVIGENAFSSFF